MDIPLTPDQFLEELRKAPLVGILRDPPVQCLEHLPAICTQASLRFIEITMNSVGAAGLIENLCRYASDNGSLCVGAGTVRTVQELEIATAAGAQFIVSPGLNPQVVHRCCELNIPCLPGALTPSEIQQAWECGATLVKVFPVQAMGGPSYIKELRGPFRDIPLLACGGVSPANAAAYRLAGIDAVAFGASIFSTARLARADYDAIAHDIRTLHESLLSTPEPNRPQT